MDQTDFWNDVFSKQGFSGGVKRPKLDDPSLNAALAHFGDITGRTIIDMGCGRGEASLFFASHGATVLAIDTSEVAVDNLNRFCEREGISTITARVHSAMALDALGEHDLVYGSLILHHLEPFAEFAATLRATVRPGGRAFFYENNAASKAMVWFRDHLVGRAWIPKYGDPDEFPLTPDEVDQLRRHFTVRQEYPELLLFELFSAYVLKNKLKGPMKKLDQRLHKYPAIRKHSYRQQLFLS